MFIRNTNCFTFRRIQVLHIGKCQVLATKCIRKGIIAEFIHALIMTMSHVYDITLWLSLLATDKSASLSVY